MVIYVLAAALLSWVIARLIKITIDTSKAKGFSWKMLFQDGGMPSGHTAITVGLCTALYLDTGFSYMLAISLIMMCIVVNDALKVRRLTGEQSKVINKLTLGKKGFDKLEERAGHTIPEVIIGGAIGVLVPAAIFLLF